MMVSMTASTPVHKDDVRSNSEGSASDELQPDERVSSEEGH